MARTFSAGMAFIATLVMTPVFFVVFWRTMFVKPARETLRANSFAFSFELKAPSWMSQYVPGARFGDFLVAEDFEVFELAGVEFEVADVPPSFAIILLAEAAVC